MNISKPDLSTTLEHYGCDLSRARTTGWAKVKCPFHDDRTPSASVNLEAGKFRCFVCDKQGDSIDLIMEAEGISFKDAIAYARDKFDYKGTGVRQAATARYRPSWSQDDD